MPTDRLAVVTSAFDRAMAAGHLGQAQDLLTRVAHDVNDPVHTATIARMEGQLALAQDDPKSCLLYTSPSPRDGLLSRMPSSA